MTGKESLFLLGRDKQGREEKGKFRGNTGQQVMGTFAF